MLETIGIAKLVTENEISKNLNLLFPKLKFLKIDLDTNGDDKLKLGEVDFVVYTSKSEYPIRIEILFQQKINTEEREQYIAMNLSKMLNCKIMVGYQKENCNNPFLNLVFENGKAFLADDKGTQYFEEGKSDVEILEEFNFAINWQFDGIGNKIKE